MEIDEEGVYILRGKEYARLKKIQAVVYDLCWGPPGPHVSDAEQEAWTSMCKDQLHDLIKDVKKENL